MSNCVVCQGAATVYNEAGQPTCSRHRRDKVKVPDCPECGMPMASRKGKFGVFWGCTAYPNCMGTVKM